MQAVSCQICSYVLIWLTHQNASSFLQQNWSHKNHAMILQKKGAYPHTLHPRQSVACGLGFVLIMHHEKSILINLASTHACARREVLLLAKHIILHTHSILDLFPSLLFYLNYWAYSSLGRYITPLWHLNWWSSFNSFCNMELKFIHAQCIH